MRYDQRSNYKAGGNSDMSEHRKYLTSPPSSRYGEEDVSTASQSRTRRSRLDKDIQQPQLPLIHPPMRLSKNQGIDPNIVNGRRSVGHNSTFNGYENFQRPNYSVSRNGNDTISGRFPSARNISSYANEYLKTRGNVGLLPTNMREPRRPRSTVDERYNNPLKGRSGFGGYESASLSTSEDGKGVRPDSDRESILDDEEDEEEMRKYYLQSQRAEGSRSVTSTIRADRYVEGGEVYYFGVVHLDLELVAHVMKTIPPPTEYYDLQPIEKVAYIFYCAVYKKPYHSIEQFHKRFNREFYKFVCAGDSNDLALFKICKSMQDQYTLRQLEDSKRAYEKAQKDAIENAKLDFNQRGGDGIEDKHSVVQPEEVLSNGPLKFHAGHAFATFGIGGKMVVIRPAGCIDPNNGATLSTASVTIDDIKSMLLVDEQSNKVIEAMQSFKGPLLPGQTPTHSVRLYIQRQIDTLRTIEKKGEVKKSEIVDALLVWQLLEMMVQQYGRITGPDIATLLTNASEELAEKSGIVANGHNEGNGKVEAKERFNKFLLGGHINEAVESAITDGLYADAMTLIRRLHPNDIKKIEEIEARFMHLRAVDDPFATLVAVSSNQPPPILTNSSFDDDNNWKRHVAIVLANLNSPTAMQTVYHIGLMLARRERHCAADFCLLVVCILAGYDPFIPVQHVDGEEKSRKHIGLIHSGSQLLNRIDGLNGIAGFALTDLHATDIYDYALRLSNNSLDSPLARSVEYQLARIEYARKLSSYGGFATDAFRYCTEIARSLWPTIAAFPRDTLLELADLAESLQYVSAAIPAEYEWITSLRQMLDTSFENGNVVENQNVTPNPPISSTFENNPHHAHESLSTEATKWHDEHQTPIEMIDNRSTRTPSPPPPTHPPTISSSTSAETNETSSTINAVSESSESSLNSSAYEFVAPTPPAPPSIPECTPVYKRNVEPIGIPKKTEDEHFAKSPRTELEDLWSSSSPPPALPNPQASKLSVQQQPMIRNVPEVKKLDTVPKSISQSSVETLTGESKKEADRKTSWFGSIKQKVIKSIPSTNQMILPDDSKPAIVWDPVQKKYVGGGIEEEVVAAPPPVMAAPHMTGSGNSSTNSLRNARSGGGSRYALSSLKTTSVSPPMGDMASSMVPPPMMPLPTSFGFIPAAAEEDSCEYVDPFSGEANPTLPVETKLAE